MLRSALIRLSHPARAHTGGHRLAVPQTLTATGDADSPGQARMPWRQVGLAPGELLLRGRR